MLSTNYPLISIYMIIRLSLCNSYLLIICIVQIVSVIITFIDNNSNRVPCLTFSIHKIWFLPCPTDPPVSIEISGWTKDDLGKAGHKIKLTCRATGGNPPPTISWARRGKAISSQRSSDKQNQQPKKKKKEKEVGIGHLRNVVKSDIELVLEAEDDNGLVECHANNDMLDVPLTANVTLAVMCKHNLTKIN